MPSDPTEHGLPETAVEVEEKRRRHDKTFVLPDGQRVAVCGQHMHYEDGGWRDANVDWLDRGGGEFVVRRNEVQARMTEQGLDLYDRTQRRGIRWLLPVLPEVTGRRARLRAQRLSGAEGAWAEGLTWDYTLRRSGAKLEARVTSSRGPRTYSFRYRPLGNVELELDVNGHLVATDSSFYVARASALGANGLTYEATPWWEMSPYRVAFHFDDTELPPDAYPYVLDPTTNFAITAGTNDGYWEQVGLFNPKYPPLDSSTNGVTAVNIRTERIYQSLNTNYYVSNGLMRWDTSTIDDTATITGCDLQYVSINSANADARNLTLDWYDFGASITSADYALTAGTNAYVGTSLSAVGGAGVTRTIAIENFAANVNKTGFTGLRTHVSGGQPAGVTYIDIASYEHASYAEPKLLVTYTVPVPPAPPTAEGTRVFIGSGF